MIFTKPLLGTSGAVFGGSSLNVTPSEFVSESSSGLNDKLPLSDKAVSYTHLTLPTKRIV